MTELSVGWVDELAGMLAFTLPARRLQVDWSWAESVIGSAFPADYRCLIDKLGPGEVGDEIVVKAPGLYTPDGDLFWHSREIMNGLESAFQSVGDEVLPPGATSVSRLLSWGYSPSGATFFWITEGPSDDWLIAVTAGPSWEVLHCGVAVFIVRLLREDISLSQMRPGSQIERIYHPAPVNPSGS